MSSIRRKMPAPVSLFELAVYFYPVKSRRKEVKPTRNPKFLTIGLCRQYLDYFPGQKGTPYRQLTTLVSIWDSKKEEAYEKRPSMRSLTQNSMVGAAGFRDSNSRPLAPHASALPGCATPRRKDGNITQSHPIWQTICLSYCYFFFHTTAEP